MGSNKGGILDQPPPSNLDAELCVIGSVLLLPACMDEVLGVISEGDFYDEANRELFSACVKIHSGGGKLDVATLSAELKARKKWEDVGGAATIAKVARAVPHAAHAEAYADLVREAARKRAWVEAALSILQDAHRPDVTADDLESMASAKVQGVLDVASKSEVSHLGEEMSELVDRIQEGEGDVSPGIPTGIDSLDRHISLRGGKVYVVAARPSIGKSALALDWSVSVGMDHGPVLFYSLEMPKDELTERFLSNISGIPKDWWKDASHAELSEISKARDKYRDIKVFIDSTSSINVSRIASQSRMMQRKYGIKLVVIDYLQLVEPPFNKGNRNRENEVASISREIKKLAMTLDVPVVVLSQLNREADSAKPKLSNLRESGAIEQDADVVLFIWRDGPEPITVNRDDVHGFTVPDDSGVQMGTVARPGMTTDELTITVAKNRGGARGADVKVVFHKELSRFEEALYEPEQASDGFYNSLEEGEHF